MLISILCFGLLFASFSAYILQEFCHKIFYGIPSSPKNIRSDIPILPFYQPDLFYWMALQQIPEFPQTQIPMGICQILSSLFSEATADNPCVPWATIFSPYNIQIHSISA